MQTRGWVVIEEQDSKALIASLADAKMIADALHDLVRMNRVSIPRGDGKAVRILSIVHADFLGIGEHLVSFCLMARRGGGPRRESHRDGVCRRISASGRCRPQSATLIPRRIAMLDLNARDVAAPIDVCLEPHVEPTAVGRDKVKRLAESSYRLL